MAKKKVTKKTKRVSKKSSRKKVTYVEYLKHLISVSEKAISGCGDSVDEFFSNQADRIKKTLAEYRAKK